MARRRGYLTARCANQTTPCDGLVTGEDASLELRARRRVPGRSCRNGGMLRSCGWQCASKHDVRCSCSTSRSGSVGAPSWWFHAHPRCSRERCERRVFDMSDDAMATTRFHLRTDTLHCDITKSCRQGHEPGRQSHFAYTRMVSTSWDAQPGNWRALARGTGRRACCPSLLLGLISLLSPQTLRTPCSGSHLLVLAPAEVFVLRAS